jgi:bifunctional non-homologous end joining protein LigD
MSKDIFDAARSGEIETVKAQLAQGIDLTATNQYGFSALHCAAVACNSVDEQKALAVLDLLLEAGSPVDATSRDGRTALYLAAEFSPTLAPLKALIQAGAKVDVRNAHGVHIVTNAMAKEVQGFLSDLTGHPIPPRRVLKPVKLSSAEWRAAKVHIDKVFDALSQSGLVALQHAGTTQEDGFSDCAEAFRARGGIGTGLRGFCFYTLQDLNRAKRTSQLSLAFWGAPDGAPEAMARVGQQVVDAFRKNGFMVDWNGSPSMRPTVYLQNIGHGHDGPSDGFLRRWLNPEGAQRTPPSDNGEPTIPSMPPG